MKQTNQEQGVTVLLPAPSGPTVVNVDDQIKQEIAKFNLADFKIEELKQQYGSLTIAGPEDVKGYKVVRAAWREVQTVRTNLEKKGLELRNRYNTITKAISKEEDRLKDLVIPLEQQLHKKWKTIDNEKEAAAREKERLEQQQLMDRITELTAIGMTLSGAYYQVGNTVTIDVATLRSMDEEQFGKFKAAAQQRAAEVKAEQDRLAAEEKSKREELQRQQQELKAQQDKLAKEKKELEEQRKELETAKRVRRMDRIKAIGMAFNVHTGNFEYKPGGDFHTIHEAAPLLQLDDYGFDEHFKVLTVCVKDTREKWEAYQQEQEKAAKDREERKKAIAAAMKAAGLTYDYANDAFVFQNSFFEVAYSMQELLTFPRQTVDTIILDAANRITEAKKQQLEKDEADRLKAQQEADAKLDDAQKFINWVENLLAVPVPQFKHTACTKEVEELRERLSAMLADFKHTVNNLSK